MWISHFSSEGVGEGEAGGGEGAAIAGSGGVGSEGEWLGRGPAVGFRGEVADGPAVFDSGGEAAPAEFEAEIEGVDIAHGGGPGASVEFFESVTVAVNGGSAIDHEAEGGDVVAVELDFDGGHAVISPGEGSDGDGGSETANAGDEAHAAHGEGVRITVNSG